MFSKYFLVLDGKPGVVEYSEITEETKVPEIRLSTKDQLKQLGINVNFSATDSNLRDSIDLTAATAGGGLDELDIENLESDADVGSS